MTDGPDEHRILDETPANWYVQKPDGTTENIPKSPENKLLYEHNLFGVLREGNEILVFNDKWDGPRVKLTPNDDATEYELTVGGADPLHLGAHLKAEIVGALSEVYEKEDVSPLVKLYDDIRADRVRNDVMQYLAEKPPFASAVKTSPDGWLIHDHLLLTWERSFHHPDTTAYSRRGNTVAEGSSEIAYDLRIRKSNVQQRNRAITIDGAERRLTDAEMEFIAKATWAVKYAPKMEDDN